MKPPFNRAFLASATLVRWPNLLMVAALMLGLRWIVLLPIAGHFSLNPALSNLFWLLLVLDVLIVAAFGYVLNDLKDITADQVNRPDRPLVSGALQAMQVRLAMIALAAMGACVTVYLGIETNNRPWIVIYPISLMLLVGYNVWGKKWGYAGNALVSLMIAGLPWLLVLAEFELFQSLKLSYTQFYGDLRIILLVFTVLMFLANSAREIVKDLQDADGDALMGSNSIPLSFGKSVSKKILFIHLAGIFACEAVLFFVLEISIAQIILGLGVFAITLRVLRLSIKSESLIDFKRLSKGLKWLMVVGLFQLFIFPLELLTQQ